MSCRSFCCLCVSVFLFFFVIIPKARGWSNETQSRGKRDDDDDDDGEPIPFLNMLSEKIKQHSIHFTFVHFSFMMQKQHKTKIFGIIFYVYIWILWIQDNVDDCDVDDDEIENND